MARTWAADNRITEEPGHVKIKRLTDEAKQLLQLQAALDAGTAIVVGPQIAADLGLASKVDENRWPKDERPADAPKAPETAPQRRRGRPPKRAG